jgi:hypothetical protein
VASSRARYREHSGSSRVQTDTYKKSTFGEDDLVPSITCAEELTHIFRGFSCLVQSEQLLAAVFV